MKHSKLMDGHFRIVPLLVFLSVFSGVRAEGLCNKNGECSIAIEAGKFDASDICPSNRLDIEWNEGSKWRVVSCSCDCTEQSNHNWFVSSSGVVVGLDTGRVFTKAFFNSSLSPVVPDVISPHGMCEPAIKSKLSDSDYLILDKVPSNKKDPYCYNAIYVKTSSDDVSISKNSGGMAKSDSDYYSDVDDVTKSKLMQLVASYAPFDGSSDAGQVEGSGSSKEQVVTSVRANLYSNPTDGGATKAYLVSGDKVEVIGKSGDGIFALVIYKSKTHGDIKKWVKCSDLDGCN
jgi:hypothetical protein